MMMLMMMMSLIWTEFALATTAVMSDNFLTITVVFIYYLYVFLDFGAVFNSVTGEDEVLL